MATVLLTVGNAAGSHPFLKICLYFNLDLTKFPPERTTRMGKAEKEGLEVINVSQKLNYPNLLKLY